MIKNNLEETSLFDFAYEQVTYSEEEIQEAFALLVQRKKEKGNYYGLSNLEIDDIEKFFPIFEERKWLKGQQVRRDLLDYHTVDEVIEKIEDYVDKLLGCIDKGEVINWYEHTWKHWDSYIPLDMSENPTLSRQLKSQVYKLTEIYSKEIALKLGLKHYMENPKSRSSEMNAFSSKGYQKHFIPYLEQEIVNITDYEEMKKFFDCYFLVGRRDDFHKSYSNYKVIPYPLFERITLNELEIVTLCQADKSNVKTVLKTMLKHMGKSSCGNAGLQYKTVRYTSTFTYQDYLNSLTSEDIVLILEDIQRIESLHPQHQSEVS